MHHEWSCNLLCGCACSVAAKKKSLSGGAVAGIVLGIVAALTAIGIYAFWQKRRAERLKHIAQPFGKS